MTVTATSPRTGADRPTVDPRAPRFGAALTTVVLAAALLSLGSPLGPALGTALLVWQAVAFGLGAMVGLRAQPYGVVFRRWVRPRLGPPAELEDAAAPRFAQSVGLAFVLVALLALALSATAVAYAAVAAALAAAFLNAAFDVCLGCEVYLRARRLLAPAPPR